MRGRIDSAHVLALIAIVMAVGGNAFAFTLGKNSVGPKQLKRGAVTKQKVRKNAINGSKVKNNSLTGADINLDQLGTVPSANTATTAGTANTATTAGTANTATTAGTADTATTAGTADTATTAGTANTATTAGFAGAAGNASRLEGLGVDAFARSIQIDSGSGDNTIPSETPLISFPEIGLEVRTDGDADGTNQLRFVNTRASGDFLFWSTGQPNAVGTLPASANSEVTGPGGGGALSHDVVFALRSGGNTFEPSPVVSISCRFNVPQTVACLGIRSP
jgi:hypothetical protein